MIQAKVLVYDDQEARNPTPEQNLQAIAAARLELDYLEHEVVDAAIELAGDNHTQAAELLGMSRYSLVRRLRRFAARG